MIAYSYDNNGIYTGTVAMQKHPLKSSEYLVPMNATMIEPPDVSTYSADKVPSFNQDTQSWVLVESPQKIEEDKAKLDLENSYGVKLYEKDIEGNVIAREASIVEEETLNIYKEDKYIEEKMIMDTNILNKVKEVTNASTPESAQAFISSYQVRVNNAADYVNEGLIVRYALDAYALNDALDTEAKIVDYYNKLLVHIDKFREQAIATYITNKQAIAALTVLPTT